MITDTQLEIWLAASMAALVLSALWMARGLGRGPRRSSSTGDPVKPKCQDVPAGEEKGGGHKLKRRGAALNDLPSPAGLDIAQAKREGAGCIHRPARAIDVRDQPGYPFHAGGAAPDPSAFFLRTRRTSSIEMYPR